MRTRSRLHAIGVSRTYSPVGELQGARRCAWSPASTRWTACTRCAPTAAGARLFRGHDDKRVSMGRLTPLGLPEALEYHTLDLFGGEHDGRVEADKVLQEDVRLLRERQAVAHLARRHLAQSRHTNASEYRATCHAQRLIYLVHCSEGPDAVEHHQERCSPK